LEKNTYRVLKIVIQSFYVILKTIFSPENSAQLGGNSCFREIFLCHLFQLGGRLEEKVSFLKLVDLPREAKLKIGKMRFHAYLSIPGETNWGKK
jgi:hypothetical protein